jgi:hypothetical protein
MGVNPYHGHDLANHAGAVDAAVTAPVTLDSVGDTTVVFNNKDLETRAMLLLLHIKKCEDAHQPWLASPLPLLWLHCITVAFPGNNIGHITALRFVTSGREISFKKVAATASLLPKGARVLLTAVLAAVGAAQGPGRPGARVCLQML